MVAAKLIPHLLSWTGIVLLLLRGFPERRKLAGGAAVAGFASGVALAFFLLRAFPGDLSFEIIRDAVGGSFLLLWGISVAALYASTGRRDFSLSRVDRLVASGFGAGASALFAGLLAGAICGCRLSGSEGPLPAQLALVLGAALLALAAFALEKRLPASFTLSRAGLAAALVSLLIYSSSCLIRLDLFSPLTMKVMKFAHDFVHQFFESMLIPDHFFFNSFTWDFIGFFFGKAVGFWGGLLLWFTPVLLVALAIQFEPLPQVSQIRQGAQRRRVLAGALRARRYKLVIPVLAALILAGAVYRSRFPSVEYWDPKPLPVAASPSGEIFIPLKGEVDLEDGKLHKYLYKQGDREARFFVLMTPAGQLTVDLDACAICKPDGYGQTEGTVLCYYCKTLIPLETVGKPGGCNPVPVPFTAQKDGVHINGVTLLSRWGETVQSTTGKKEVPK